MKCYKIIHKAERYEQNNILSKHRVKDFEVLNNIELNLSLNTSHSKYSPETKFNEIRKRKTV